MNQAWNLLKQQLRQHRRLSAAAAATSAVGLLGAVTTTSSSSFDDFLGFSSSPLSVSPLSSLQEHISSATITTTFHNTNKTLCDSAAPVAQVKELGPSSTSSPSKKRKKKKNDSSSSSTKSKNESFHVKDVYDIQGVLGEGGYGMVFLAHRKSDGIAVALKTMNKQYTNPKDFEREVTAMKILSEPGHEHVVRLYDLHIDKKHYYLAMELIEGGELFELLIQHGPYSEAVAADFVRQVADALCFVHNAGLTHADLKPENLMMSSHDSENAKLKVVDFGCAIPVTEEAKKKGVLEGDEEVPIKEESFAGTIAYWPPEMFLNSPARPSQAADMWATGVIVYVLLTGTHPFDKFANSTDDEIEENIVKCGADKKWLDLLVFDERTDGLSDSCIDLLKALMEPDPQKRMTSQEFRDHPWVQGLTAKQETMEGVHDKLQEFWRNRFRAEIMEKFAANFGISGKDMLSEKNLLKIFVAMDLKKNGVLDMEEIHTTFRGLGVPDEDIEEIFKSADLDQTGEIHFDEFLCVMRNSKMETFWQGRFRSHILKKFAAMTGGGTSEAHLEKLFHALDLKKNGVLEYEEVHSAFQGLGMSDQDIRTIFDSADLDKSGVLQLDEFVAVMQNNSKIESLWHGRFRSNILKKFAASKGISVDGELSEDDLKALFDALDLKKNGVLDLEEIQTTFRALGIPDKDISEIFACADLDKSGSIGFDEFQVVMGNSKVETLWQDRFRANIIKRFSSDAKIPAEDLLNENTLREFFNKLDLKGNGVLELEEIQSTFRSMGVPDKDIKEIFSCADLDGSGVINFNEFITLMRTRLDDRHDLQLKYRKQMLRAAVLEKFPVRSKEMSDEHLRTAFAAIDLDGNGSLDSHETSVLLRSAGVAEDVVDKIVESLHEDGLSLEEFMKIMHSM